VIGGLSPARLPDVIGKAAKEGSSYPLRAGLARSGGASVCRHSAARHPDWSKSATADLDARRRNLAAKPRDSGGASPRNEGSGDLTQ
jgi:hypothetical protein